MKLKLLALAASAMMATTAHAAIVYTGTIQAGPETVGLSFTTDGTLGNLEPSEITDFAISISDALSSKVLTPANVLTFQGDLSLGGLIATPSTLSFDFSKGLDYSETLAVLDGPGRYQIYFTHNNIFVQNDGDDYGFREGSIAEPSAVVVVATNVSAAPEPSTWALMLAGVGLIGLALRRRSGLAVA